MVDTNITDRSGLLSLEIPVMTSNMDTITEVDMANFIRSKGGVGVLHRFMSIEENVKMLGVCNSPVFVSVGCSEEDLQRAEALGMRMRIFLHRCRPCPCEVCRSYPEKSP
ncbi:MAG: hypothetical protein Ct9H90mP9_1440 [Pseudomonadota bacterium]|nr:MAG: hypothetical protein Ct9H90mP9_1440 [Pseudomonadota bacterium]